MCNPKDFDESSGLDDVITFNRFVVDCQKILFVGGQRSPFTNLSHYNVLKCMQSTLDVMDGANFGVCQLMGFRFARNLGSPFPTWRLITLHTIPHCLISDDVPGECSRQRQHLSPTSSN